MNENSHILIVDDDNRIRELIKEYLEEKNFIGWNKLALSEKPFPRERLRIDVSYGTKVSKSSNRLIVLSSIHLNLLLE